MIKPSYKRSLLILACLTLMTITSCGGGHDQEEFDEGESVEVEGSETLAQCTEDDWSACNVFAGEVCFAGLCVGGKSRGGGGECSHSVYCPNIGDVCSNGVCI